MRAFTTITMAEHDRPVVEAIVDDDGDHWLRVGLSEEISIHAPKEVLLRWVRELATEVALKSDAGVG